MLNNTREQNNQNSSKSRRKNTGEIKYTTKEKSPINLEKTLLNEAKNLNAIASAAKKEENKKLIKTCENSVISNQEAEIEQLIKAVTTAKKSIVKEISDNFEQKLEKLDEAIIELVSCKAENERLKAKIDNLTRENYKLKKEIKSFKAIMPGFYVKVKKDDINL